MAPLIVGLLAKGLDLVANAALAKGKEYIEEKTGLKLETDKPPSEEAVLKLKQFQLENATELEKLKLENNKLDAYVEEMYLKDIQDARKRDVEYVRIGRNNTRGDVLAYGAIGALLACIFLLFFSDVPQGSRDLLLVTLGALVAIVKDVYGFEFGSSKDSQRNAQAVVNALNSGG